MFRRFRASIVVVMLFGATTATQAQQAAAQALSCGNRRTLSESVDFADRHRAQTLLAHKDRWAAQLSDFDMGARQKTAEPTDVKTFLDFAAAAGRGWTAEETNHWQVLVDRLSDAMTGLNLHLPAIDLVKTSGEEELGSAAYTRRNAIMLAESAISLPATDARRAYFLLAHEVFHVLSRVDSRRRDDLYALLGFKRVDGFGYPAELEDRRLSNPDAFEYRHTLTVQSESGSVDVMPVIQSLLPLEEAIQLPNFFDALDIVLLSVDAGTGEALRDGSGDLIRYNFGNTNWVPLMLRNSSYIIHPEEILADNFATLMEWRSDGVLAPQNPDGFPANDVDLLVALEGVLTSGCAGSVRGVTGRPSHFGVEQASSRTDITVASERYIVTPSPREKGWYPRVEAGGTARNGFSHPRQVACRLQRNRCADGERHGKARLMNTGKGGKLWRSSPP